MRRQNSCKPFRRVRSIRRRFENTEEFLQLTNSRRNILDINAGYVKDKTLIFERQSLGGSNNNLEYHDPTDTPNNFNGNLGAPSMTNVDNSFENVIQTSEIIDHNAILKSSKLPNRDFFNTEYVNSKGNVHYTYNKESKNTSTSESNFNEEFNEKGKFVLSKPKSQRESLRDTKNDDVFSVFEKNNFPQSPTNEQDMPIIVESDEVSYDNKDTYTNNREYGNTNISKNDYTKQINNEESNFTSSRGNSPVESPPKIVTSASTDFYQSTKKDMATNNIFGKSSNSMYHAFLVSNIEPENSNIGGSNYKEEINFISSALKPPVELSEQFKSDVYDRLPRVTAYTTKPNLKRIEKQTESQEIISHKLDIKGIPNKESMVPNPENEETSSTRSKYTILKIARQYRNLHDDDDDIFGSHLNIETDFCVETYNNGNTNVLFKMWIDRDLLTEDNGDGQVLIVNDNIDYNELGSQNENEEGVYCLIDNISKEEEVELEGTEYVKASNVSENIKLSDEEAGFMDESSGDTIELSRNERSNLLNIPLEQNNVIAELIDTGQNYLKNMKHIIENYLQHFRGINDISPNIEIVFGNIEQIYSESEKLYSSIQRCDSVEEIASVFLTNAHIFDLYIEYMRNKSKSYQYTKKSFSKLIKDRQDELKDRQTCESYLLNPVQRIGRYGLLLQRLRKVLSKSGESCKSLDEAIALVERKTFEGNTMIAIDSIRYCPINMERLKQYLRKDVFFINRQYKSTVFLFEEGVVFCKEDQENIDQYDFMECIEMDKLTLKHCNNSMNFLLGYYDKSKKYVDRNKYEFSMEANTEDVKDEWMNEIQRLLWRKLQYFKDMQNTVRSRVKNTHGFNKQIHEGASITEEYRLMEGAVYEKTDKIMMGTFFDEDKIPRIEITNHNFYIYDIPLGQSNVINEIITNEENYLKQMREIIDEKKTESGDENFCPYIYILVENIKGIYHETEKLYIKLLKSNSIDDFARVFRDHASIFDLYIKYMWNKSTFCRYAIDRQVELDQQQKFDSYLVDAVCRLEEYKTVLDKLDSELRKNGDLCPTLKEVITLINDKMVRLEKLLMINSIQRCPVNLHKMGNFIMKEKLTISKSKQESHIFLFQRIIIFSVEADDNSDTYIYVDSIEMTNLSVYSSGATKFKVVSTDKLQTNKKKFEIEAGSIQTKEIWINKIKYQLKNLPERNK